jgi:hypothetical protein
MFETLVAASDALQSARPSIYPALSGCPECRTVQQIAAPTLGTCLTCGTTHVVIDAARLESTGRTPSAA